MTAALKLDFEAANDSTIGPLDFEGALSMAPMGEEFKYLCVPSRTYKLKSAHRAMRVPCSHLVADGELPVVMRGAWEVFWSQWTTHSGFLSAVLSRYMRRYKITCLGRQEADRLSKRFQKLFLGGNRAKRSRYRRAARVHFSVDLYHGLCPSHTLCWVGGIRCLVGEEQVAVMKSLHRHRARMSNLEAQLSKLGVIQ